MFSRVCELWASNAIAHASVLSYGCMLEPRDRAGIASDLLVYCFLRCFGQRFEAGCVLRVAHAEFLALYLSLLGVLPSKLGAL